MNTSIRMVGTLCLIAILSGCGSAPPAPPAIMTGVDPLEQDAINALDLKLDQQAEAGLDAALKRYESLDDLVGQWRVRLVRTKIASSRGDEARAREEADKLERLAKLIDSHDAHFETLILLGQVRNESSYFQSALELASTPLQRAVVLTYLDRVIDAMALVDTSQTDHANDRAFVYFRYAQRTGRAGDFERALGAYRDAKDSRGVADTLVHLSRLAARNNDNALARSYGERAITVLTSIGDTQRAAAVQSWLDRL